jgi:hypothetical protein
MIVYLYLLNRTMNDPSFCIKQEARRATGGETGLRTGGHTI